MKKMFGTMLAVALASSALAGCGGDSEPSKDAAPAGEQGGSTEVQGKITFVTQRTDLVNDGTFDKYEEAFKKKYPKVEDIEFEGITNYESDMRVRLSANNVGDVMLIPTNIANKDLGKFFAPVNGLADSLGDLYFKDYKADNGQIYGIVSGVSTEGIVYNKKAFEKAGITSIPKTLDEFYAACEKLKASGMVPIYINNGAQWPMKEWGEVLVQFSSGDAKYLDKMIETDEPFKVDNAFGKGFTIVRTLKEKGYVEKDLYSNVWEASKGEVAGGKAGMYFLGNWVINQVIGAGAAKEDIGFFPFPYDNSGKLNAPLSADYFYGIDVNTKNKPLAEAWVKFMVEEAGYVEASGFIPPQKSKTPALEQLKEFQSYKPNFIENVPTSSKWNDIGNRAKIDFFGGKYIQDILEAKDLKEELDELNAKWKEARASVK
ncbi:ABC transporter substrate-binding protein [Paenibacillus mucilaginosus]|uniref:Extracellular solute-binding protein family 1 n=1 Tax=Paenibacillus mucilaginosus (strain KNP414) TaxID=1036673 RepID=F8F4U8_PAEMK|nr:ABC transporter substrate-binding protein [Paenibacillus mucilaginosus]AEI40678.1 extracellular solute-binding protein family 1 [Paenibacillus mucilaginosus KNP414]MCG7211834.1 ABC transporter substrate-binding protein [Paenibacillus mucilaginosus]WDM29817.1 carbohydrate ABC transporter substrate-binding protein [Paenibacillus mucilaginosus]